MAHGEARSPIPGSLDKPFAIYAGKFFYIHHSSIWSIQPVLSLYPPELPNLFLLRDLRPPNSLYISRISTLPGRVCSSVLHLSSLISLGV